ncbi:eukaryotic translation initiation factor 2D-like isoform X2 [Acanthaster planci]|uniref:Eukaryotic translation initiation factor 2D-like isoform X2 n=1 Tax=Acanthaster planci TaxID=133434 RepID=A0A8B7ZDA1_ACAPL|nr:eukaryotic translation initiation factor 2D-like isoform X2 [Acanthaster planci]
MRPVNSSIGPVYGSRIARGGDRQHVLVYSLRKLRSSFSVQFPSLDTDQVAELTPNKDDMTVMKITTHSDCTMHVYCLTGTPIFFQIEKQLYPTVYMLWKHPNLLPCLITWPPVLDKLSGGADLMLPGVVIPPSGLPQLNKDQLCAICLLGNHAPVAVGHAIMSSDDMKSSGMKGRGIQVMHCYKDSLWAQGDKSLLPEIPLPEPGGNLCEENSEEVTLSTEQNITLTDVGGLSPTVHQDETEPHIDEICLEDYPCDGGGERADEVTKNESLSPTDEMDALLYQCTLHSLKSMVKPSDLPLLTSNFYRSYVVSCCPEGQTLDIKKTSYKKLSKFLQKLHSEGFLEVREEKKGVDFITAVHKDHPDLRSFIVPASTDGFSASGVSNEASATHSQLEVRLMNGVSADMLPILKVSGYGKGDWLTHEALREAVTKYIKGNDLTDEENPRMVNLDGPLHEALINRSEGYVEKLRWDQVFSRCNGRMTAGHEIILPGQRSVGQIRKGKLQPIQIKLEKKSGNKNVTVIQNIEPYGIEPKDFAHRLQITITFQDDISKDWSWQPSLERKDDTRLSTFNSWNDKDFSYEIATKIETFRERKCT